MLEYRGFESFCSAYFYNPNWWQKILSFLLLPFSLIYCFISRLKFSFSRSQKDLGIAVFSVGNLVVGGAGKSPLCKAIYSFFNKMSEYKNSVFIVLRGYKRKSRGCLLVSQNGEILVPCEMSGDEAMDYAINGANVIVSEDREAGILKAKELGAKIVILDDGFRHFGIKKFDILLKPFSKPYNDFCLPSGAYRVPKSFYALADFIPSNDDIVGNSRILYPTERMVLVSGIANPQRLKEHYAKCVAHYHFSDHYDFRADELQKILAKHVGTSLLVTSKDYAKIKDFNLAVSIIELNLTLSQKFQNILLEYAKNFKDQPKDSK